MSKRNRPGDLTEHKRKTFKESEEESGEESEEESGEESGEESEEESSKEPEREDFDTLFEGLDEEAMEANETIYVVTIKNDENPSASKSIVLKLKMNKVIPYRRLDRILKNLPDDNSEFEQNYYGMLWFNINRPTQNYDNLGHFTIVGIEQINNANEEGSYEQFPFLVENTISHSAYYNGLEIGSQPIPSLGTYLTPNSEIWIGMGGSGLKCEDLIEQENKINLTTLDPRFMPFIEKYPDYVPFITFVYETICGKLNDIFCGYYLARLSPADFTEKTPTEELNFNNVPPEELVSATPFFDALRYIYKRINVYHPSIVRTSPTRVTEYSFFIKLNRLIYYYNIFNLLNADQLHGFEDTAIVLIYTHGGYIEPDDIKTIESPLENLFVYSKAAIGFETYDACKNIFPDAEDGDFMDQMYDSVLEDKFIPFDSIVFRRNDKRKCPERCYANCFIENLEVGKARQHYISPNTKQYLNKIYTSNSDASDNRLYIIDVEEFRKSKMAGLPLNEQLRRANILARPEIDEMMESGFIYRTPEENSGVLYYNIEMSAVVNYYSRVLGKKNLFLYDSSCGDYNGTKVLKDVIPRLIQHGLGKKQQKINTRNKSKKRKTRKQSKKRKTRKQSKNRKTRKQSKNLKNRKTRRRR